MSAQMKKLECRYCSKVWEYGTRTEKDMALLLRKRHEGEHYTGDDDG